MARGFKITSSLKRHCLFRGKFQWRNLRWYLSWIMHMAFTWSPPNVGTTSWCQLKSTKEYSPTKTSLDQMGNCLNCTTGLIFKTLPKAQRTRGLSSAYQSNFFRSYHKFLQNSWPNLASESRPRSSFITTWSISSKTMTKLQLQNLAWTSTSKYWPNLETLCSKSEQKINFMTKSPSKSATKCCQHASDCQHEQQ